MVTIFICKPSLSESFSPCKINTFLYTITILNVEYNDVSKKISYEQSASVHIFIFMFCVSCYFNSTFITLNLCPRADSMVQQKYKFSVNVQGYSNYHTQQ